MESLKSKKILYKSMLSRDPRHDGRFYIGVITTGIYCRPICPAKPKFQNVIFYKSKAEAELAGFRPCLRCRPDLSPLSPQWSGTAAIMSRALRLVESSDLDGINLCSVAEKLGVSDRHLRRLFEQHIGASPIEVAISRRLHLARQLLSQTSLSITDISMASGFQSLRRFNDAFVKIYKSNPRDYRRQIAHQSQPTDFLTIYLPYSGNYDWQNLIETFKRHESAGVDLVENGCYLRHFKNEHGLNFYKVSHQPKQSRLQIELKIANLNDLRSTIDQIRRQFDLAHNPYHIPASRFKEIRSVRIPGAFNPFEVAVSIILGQLVSTEQGKTNVRKLVYKHGEKVKKTIHPDLNYLFPTAEVLKSADFSGLGFTQARAEAIAELSRMVANQEIELSPHCDLEQTRAKLLSIKGIGPWTAEMIGLRCLNDANAFPAKDLNVLRALEKFKIDHESFAPWRAYLTMAIWKTQAHLLTKKSKRLL